MNYSKLEELQADHIKVLQQMLREGDKCPSGVFEKDKLLRLDIQTENDKRKAQVARDNRTSLEIMNMMVDIAEGRHERLKCANCGIEQSDSLTTRRDVRGSFIIVCSNCNTEI